MNYSLRGVDIEPRTAEWRKRPSPKSPPVRAETSGRAEGRVLARSDRPGPIELLAARYPVIRRLVGELSFRVVARRFILTIRQAAWFLIVLATIFPILFEAWAMPHVSSTSRTLPNSRCSSTKPGMPNTFDPLPH